MSNIITWEQFEYVNSSNPYDAFEDLTRLYFKLKYARNINIELIAKNKIHPGFEADPIEINGKRLAFQSKYSKSSVYSSFIKSLKVAEKKYKGKIDIIYLFTNCGLDSACESYKEILKIGKRIGAKIIPVINKTILDSIENDDDFKNVRACFFNKHDLDALWFENMATNALGQQKEKYSRDGFNVITNEIGRLMSVVFENSYKSALSNLVDNIYRLLNGLLNKKYLFGIDREFDKRLADIVEKYVSKDITESECLELPNKVDEIGKEVNFKINNLNEQINNDEEDDPKKRETVYYLHDVNNVIEEIELANGIVIHSSIAKTHIIEGEFGCGKTHLFKYVTDRRLQQNERVLLLYGESFLYNELTIEEEILKCLDISNISFDDFLGILEAKGERDGEYTYLLIDAINECSNYLKWKTSLGNLISKLSTFKHIKLFISLRNSYSKECLGDNLDIFENNNKLMVHGLRGLSPYNGEINKFLDYYKVEYSGISETALEVFMKPLLLTFYCKINQGKTVGYINNVDRIGILNDYIHYEERRFREQKPNCPYLQFDEVIRIIGDYLVSNYCKTIPQSVLVKKLSTEGIDAQNIRYMGSSDIIEQKTHEDGSVHINFYYEAFLDKACSDSLFNGDKKICERNIVNFVGDGKRFRIIQSAISLLLNRYKKTFGEEMDGVLKSLYTKLDKNTFESIFLEYLSCLLSDADFDLKQVYSRYSKYIKSKSSYELIWNRIINYQNLYDYYPLFDDMLFDLPLATRDYVWTIYINTQFDEYRRNLKECLSAVFNKEYADINNQELILLVWLLTSSNRELRDYVSKELVKIFAKKHDVIVPLLRKYLKVNDPYIVSRILAATFGAISITENVDKTILTEIAIVVNENVFNLDIVYEDIQVRDYAKNIIELIGYRGIKLAFDIKRCFPPYNSKPVPFIAVKDVEKLYPPNDYENSIYYGTSNISFSLSPELKIGKLTSPYGDFGRYVFDSKLRDFAFKNQTKDRKRIFLYAFFYIVNVLGYKNELFTKYDKEHYSYRSRKNATERIGKKYEWLSLFHTLAKVADNYKMRSPFDDAAKPIPYSGTWDPFVRDFDPTQLLKNNDRQYETDISMYVSHFTCFEPGNHEWIDKNKESFGIEKTIILKDSKDREWVAIEAIKKDETGSIAEDKPYQSIWFRVKAYVIETKELDSIIKAFKIKNYDITNGVIYENDNYQLYAFDYCWNTSYAGYYSDNNVINITNHYQIKVKSSKKYKKEHNIRIVFGDSVLDLSDNGEYHIEHRSKTISKMLRLSHTYLWEAEYDYSKDDTISCYMPSKVLADMLKIRQSELGVWVDDNNRIVLADFSLVVESDVNGLYVRKDVLFSRMGKKQMMIWVARCELLSIVERYGSDNARFLKSTLLYIDDKTGKLEQIDVEDE